MATKSDYIQAMERVKKMLLDSKTIEQIQQEMRSHIEDTESDDKIRDTLSKTEYMTDPAHWVGVHCTKYMPKKLSDGRLAISTTAMATNFQEARATVHMTLNHTVQPNSGGNWNDMQFVILAPYSDLVQANGNPEMVSAVDTYFAPDVKTGLVLPATAHIVRPGDVADGALYKIQGKETIYKIDEFTQDDIQKILPRMTIEQRRHYDDLARDEIPEGEIKDMLRNAGEIAQKMYAGARDKNAFIRGMMRDGQNAVLANVVRDMAVSDTMQNMGYDYINGNNEYVIGAAEKAGLAMGLPASGMIAHATTLWSFVEKRAGDIMDWLNRLQVMTDFNALYDDLAHYIPEGILEPMVDDFAGVRPMTLETVRSWLERSYKSYHDIAIKQGNRVLGSDWSTSDEKKNAKITLDRVRGKESMAEYNKNLAATADKWAQQFMAKYTKWREQLARRPGYEKFVERLRELVRNRDLSNAVVAARGGKDMS